MPDAPRLVVTISRQIGSGGAMIGQMVARDLNLSYVDAEILQRAAKVLGVDDPRSIETLEERSSGGLWGRFARAIAIGAPEAPFVPPPPGIQEGHVQEAERQIIREIAGHRNAVIVGRGAAHLLTGPEILKIFVYAPRTWRVARLQESYGIGEAEARELAERSDRRRGDFVREVRGHGWTDACLYDVSLDTSVVGIDAAAAFIAEIGRRRLQGG